METYTRIIHYRGATLQITAELFPWGRIDLSADLGYGLGHVSKTLWPQHLRPSDGDGLDFLPTWLLDVLHRWRPAVDLYADARQRAQETLQSSDFHQVSATAKAK